METILTSDIGGTNSRFAAFKTTEDGELTLLESVWLSTQEATSFSNLLYNLEQSGFPHTPKTCDAVVAAVPGPVQKKRYAHLANVPWAIDTEPLREELGEDKVFLINDFVAQVYACRTEAVSNAVIVKQGKAVRDAPIAVIGAGTGLGHCALLPDGHGGFLPQPSEGGHLGFPFVGEQEHEYEAFLRNVTGEPFIYGDIVVSGRGLSLLHRYLTGEDLEPRQVAEKLTPDSETTIMFSRFYARVCRNYALMVLPQAGLYIAGGVASKNQYLVCNDAFREEFVLSPAHHSLLEQIPVLLNTNEESGLWGAAYYGLIAIGVMPLQGIS